MFLNKMSLKAERVSIYKAFIEVAEKKRYVVSFNGQVLEIVVVLDGAYSFWELGFLPSICSQTFMYLLYARDDGKYWLIISPAESAV